MNRLGAIRLWCPETIQEVLGIDDRYVAVRGHSSLFAWDHRDGTRATIDPRTVPRGTGEIRIDVGRRNHVAISPDGAWVAAATFGNRVRVWNHVTGELKFAGDPEHAFDDVAFSPDGTRIVGTADAAYVWNRGLPGQDAVRIPGPVLGARLDRDGDVIGAEARHLVGRWATDGALRTRVSVRHRIDSFSPSADGRHAAITTICTQGLCMDGLPDVVIADLAAGRAIVRFHDPASPSRRAVLSPDAKWLALVDDTVRIVSAAPRPAWSAPPVLATWPVVHVAFSADDRALVVGPDGAELRRVPTGEVLARVPLPDDARPRFVAGDRWLAELAADQRTIRFRDPRTLAVTHERAFDSLVDAFDVSPDGTVVVTDGPSLLVG